MEKNKEKINRTMITLNNYKENQHMKNMLPRAKRGQLAIFVIIALLLVGALVVYFLVFQTDVGTTTGLTFSPQKYLSDCVEPQIRPAMQILSDQGAYQNPEGFITIDGQNIQYLCYTDDPYETCVVQQPMTKQKYERELNLMIKGNTRKCIENLKGEYESRGFTVNSPGAESSVNLIPGQVLLTYNAPFTIKKGDNTQTYQNFDISLKSEMYDLLFIAQSIIDYESSFGDSATELYLQYYPNLLIRKTKLSDGTTIYKLNDVTTQENFQFASRSLTWPAGYGFDEITNA